MYKPSTVALVHKRTTLEMENEMFVVNVVSGDETEYESEDSRQANKRRYGVRRSRVGYVWYGVA